MIVSCPHCSAVYELPRHLLGPGGAAVRCPHCAGEFTLGADGVVVSAPGAERPGTGRRREEGPVHAAAPAPAAKTARKAARAREEAAPGAVRIAAAEPDEPAQAASDARAIARRVLDELAARKGSAMSDANARGRLLSEFGPELAAAFEEYRRESGGSGNPAPFREELRARWGLDLTPAASES